MTKYALGFAAGFILAIGFSGKAVELFAEGGQCRFDDAHGAFYHGDLPTHNYLTPRCGSIGLQDKFEDGKWGWRIAYLESGSIKARDNIARQLDNSYETTAPCDTSTWIGCHARINGSGYVYGFSFGITRELDVYKGLKVIPEGGLFHFRSVFRASIRAVDFNCGGCEWYVQEDSGWKAWPAPYAGLTLRYGHIYAAARYYWSSGHRALSLADLRTQFSLGAILATF